MPTVIRLNIRNVIFHIYIYFLFLDRADWIRKPEYINQIISARLSTVKEDPDKSIRNTVQFQIIYGSCETGSFNNVGYIITDSSNGFPKYSKYFLKPHYEVTIIQKNEYSVYIRPVTDKF